MTALQGGLPARTPALARVLNRRSLFVLDALLFLPIGIIVMIFPNPESTLTVTSFGALMPALEDTRRLLGSQYLAVGLLLVLCATPVIGATARNWVCRVRALSLLALFAANVAQYLGGSWNSSILIWLVIFPLEALAYAYFGFLRPETEQKLP
jgi:hypothetical protein